MKITTQSTQIETRAPLNRLTHPWFLALAMSALLGAQVTVLADEHDPKIESETKATYVFRKILRNSHLEAKSKDGVVTLTGNVDLESQRQLAQATATGVDGVKGVENLIVVKEGPTENSDTGIFMKLTSALAYHRSANAAGTVVEVKDGVATLKGKAATEEQRELMTGYVKDVEGVKDVKNEMTVVADNKPASTMMESVDDASVSAQVSMALLAHRSTSALGTAVSCVNGVVTLSGEASTKAESDHIEKLVLDINGVRKVVNTITIKQTAEVRN